MMITFIMIAKVKTEISTVVVHRLQRLTNDGGLICAKKKID